MVNNSEVTEQNGPIVTLNQEKAYDKIHHDYLIKILENYNPLESFTQIIKSLYENAETVVIINGVISPPFKVSRGICQGDPLLCLLFNIAIGLLANMLCQTNTLNVSKIPGVDECLIVTLFANDTTVYLRQNDNIGKLFKILNRWCIASGAKFNIKKTVVLPISTLTYRQGVITNQKSMHSTTYIETNIHIAT